ncbi:hypothetical protein OROGR_029757 [Orobanche gracilis]
MAIGIPKHTISTRVAPRCPSTSIRVKFDLSVHWFLPVAACVIYKSLLHWRSFEVERTNVFDRIIQTVASVIDVKQNIIEIIYISQPVEKIRPTDCTLKASGAASLTPQRRRMSQGFRSSPQSSGLSFLNSRMLGRLDDLRQVEAKYPALLFKQQLTAFLEKIYGMIRDNLKKEISPLLGLCIQSPQNISCKLSKQTFPSKCSCSISSSLFLFTQIFSFISVQLFNSLLLRRECCSFSNGEYVKAGLAELEQWCCFATEEAQLWMNRST